MSCPRTQKLRQTERRLELATKLLSNNHPTKKGRAYNPNSLEVHFMLPAAEYVYGNANLTVRQDLAHVLATKSTKICFNDHGIAVLDW